MIVSEEDLLSASEVAEMMGVTVRTVQRWVRAGHFPDARQGLGKGGKLHIPRENVEAFMTGTPQRVQEQRQMDAQEEGTVEDIDELYRPRQRAILAALRELAARYDWEREGRRLALIVEDDEDAQRVFELTLKGAGFETVTVGSGEKALSVMESMVPDVVVLDLHLPDVAGTEVLRRMREDAKLAQVPVIVATAYPELAEEIEDQADLVLVKPVRYGILQAKVAELTGA